MPREEQLSKRQILGAKSPNMNAYDKWKFEHTITSTAGDMISGLTARYTHTKAGDYPEFGKHENKFRDIWADRARSVNPKLDVARALIDCVLDGFNEVKVSNDPSITYPIGLDDILETIDQRKIEATRGLDTHTLQVTRCVCAYYITAYMALPNTKKEPEGRKYGDFLIACSTLTMLNQFRPVINEE